jgi:hypothetical protein
MSQTTTTPIPAHLPKFVHLCDGDQLLNVEAGTIQSFDESYEVFAFDEAFKTADDIAQFCNDLTEAVGPEVGDELFIYLMNQHL